LLQEAKLKQAIGILNEENVDMWIIFEKETPMNSDPVHPLIYPNKFLGTTMVIICKNGESYIIADHLDGPGHERLGLMKHALTYPNGANYRELFFEVLAKEQPKQIALNYSKDNCAADGLGYGAFLELKDALKTAGWNGEIISAEGIIGKLRGRKLPEEIECIKKACDITEMIFNDAKDFVKAGVTEKQIFDFFHERMKFYGVEPGWTPASCPGVQVGPNTIVGHIAPGDLAAQPGDIITMDFGVKVNGYSSDMQRVFYVLKDGETEPPADLQHIFEVVQESVRRGVAAMKPGVPGYVPDEACKNYVREQGLDPIPAGFGHQIGLYVHDGGVTMSSRQRPAAQGLLEPGLVLSLDQGQKTKYGQLGQEDDGVVTEDGCVWLSTQQPYIYCVR